MSLTPAPGYVLVRLTKKYQSELSVEKDKYEQRSSGIAVDISFPNKEAADNSVAREAYLGILGKTVYFEPFQDGIPVEREGHEYVFVPVNQIRGFDNA